jgi:multidrug resistance efflux pump
MNRVVPILAIAAVGVVGYLYWQKARPTPLVVSGHIEAEEVRVGSRVGGRTAEVLVQEGQAVKTGDPLFKLDPFDVREQLAEAEARSRAAEQVLEKLRAGYRAEEIEQARARRDRAAAVLAKLEAGPRPREIEIAREQHKVASADLELAQIEHQRYQNLREADDAAQMEFDRAVRALKAAQAAEAAAREELALLEEGTRAEDVREARAALAEADQALKLFEAGNRPEDIAEAEARLAAARAAADAIRTRLAELTVVAPCDCVVEAIDLRPGDLVGANAPTVALLDITTMWVRSYVPEARLGDVAVGRTVPFRVDAYGERRFVGKVTFVAREAEFTPKNVQTSEERSKQVFRIKVTVTEGREDLRIGMTADLLLDEASTP